MLHTIYKSIATKLYFLRANYYSKKVTKACNKKNYKKALKYCKLLEIEFTNICNQF